MVVIPNYELVQNLGESPRTIVFKAFHKAAPHDPLVLKLFKTVGFSEHRKAHFEQRLEHLRVLHDPLIITPSTFETKAGASFLTQPFFEGVTLDVLRAQHGLTLAESLKVASRLALALEKIHEGGIIHGGIKPHNILVRPDTLGLRLIDFLTPLDVREVSHFIYDPGFIANTLAYTSPEQTGRISHRVSFTSDLYSLGIVLWELMAGRLPFQTRDPLELIHCHLAEEPLDVREVNSAVPKAVAAIIAKLTLKQPDKRYQSAAGVHADLARCAEEYVATGTVRHFPLATEDRTHRIVFVSKMVGRDREAATILDAYDEVTKGSFRSVFISGLSGIGKTRLIQELQRPIVLHRGYFTSGKFDVYQRNIPYSSLIQAFKTLVRTLLTESDERILFWKVRITEAVGTNGAVLTDVIPELGLLIGLQPPVKPLPPVESRNRFLDVFDRFLGSLASETSPLTLFIDDLQWCDAASFEFLRNLFNNHEHHPYLLFIGAYRHNEVDAAHPLARLLDSIRENRRPLEEIQLTPLEPKHTHEMISYILDATPEHTEALATFIHGLTEGNPLFVSESLSYLHNEDLLLVEGKQPWHWDLDRISRSNMPSNVVALFGAKVQRLPSETIEVLEFCACMGNTFSPQDLALIRETSLLRIFEILKPALNQGLLFEAKDLLQFIHDRVQEAVLVSIDPEKRRRIHEQVGHHLLSAIPAGTSLETVDDLFAITSHLNLGRAPQLDRDAAYQLSDINFHAGQKALNALATEAANEYFRIGKDLLPEGAWETHYEQTFQIHQKLAKTELMCGHAETSERLLGELLEHARTDLDKAACLAEQTTSLSSMGNFVDAIATANRGLAYFGRSLPDDGAEANRRREEVMRRIDAEHADVWATILDMPFTDDRKRKIELAFYSELIPDLYMSGLVPQLYLAAAQSTQHCLAGGMDESVIYSFSIMGLQLGEQNDFERAFKYEDLARELSARHPNTFGATRGMNGIVWCNMHSRSRPAEIVDYSLEAIHSGKRCGDLYNAGLSYGPLMWNLEVQGENLRAIEEYARECTAFSTRFQLGFSIALARAVQAGWIEPMKAGGQPVPMEDAVEQWERDNHVAACGSYFVLLGLTHYYFGEYEQAREALTRVHEYLAGLTDNVLKRQWSVFRVLNAAALFEAGLGAKTVAELHAECDPLIATVERWAALGPLLKPYVAFMHAELARATGAREAARGLYLEAIDVANRAEYVMLEGHLCERLGTLLRDQGSKAGGIYFREAARLYRTCHAERKQEVLLERFSQYLDEDVVPARPAEPETAMEPLPSYAFPNLDANYLMTSQLAISAEIEQDGVMRRVMQAVLQSSGAQHGFLLIEDDGELFVRAESHAGPAATVRFVNQRLEEVDALCKPIVRYVHRTRERVILENAAREGQFKDNPEVRAMGVRSLLCVPVLKRARLVGVLYLENRLADGVFTAERTRTTELLTLQAAISLENARLVGEMRAAEETVRNTRNYLEHLLDDANAPVVVWDADFAVTRFNHAFECITGRHASDVLGRPVSDLFPPDHRAENVERIRRSIAGDRKPVDITIARTDGTSRILLWSSTSLHSADGAVLANIGQAQDVTDRREADDRKQFLLQLQTYLVGFTEPEALVQTAVSRLGRKLGAARGHFALVGEGEGADDLVAAASESRDPIERLGECVGDSMRLGETVAVSDAETDPRTAATYDAVCRPIGIRAWVLAPLFREREWAAFVAVVSDTPRAWTEGERSLVQDAASIVWPLYENARLLKVSEAAVRLRDEFLSIAAHELRTPLSALKLQLEAMAHELDKSSAGRVAGDLGGLTRKLTGANRQIDRLSRLVETLLDATRIARGKLELQLEDVDLQALVRETAGRFELQARAAGCELRLSGDDEVVGRWDGARLEQVVTNLLSNAIKYGAGKPVEVCVTNERGGARLTVRDEGIGISEQDRARIFDRFERAVSANHYGGLGLGLYVSEQIVTAHGGEIHVDSEVGKQTTVVVTLPRAHGHGDRQDGSTR